MEATSVLDVSFGENQRGRTELQQNTPCVSRHKVEAWEFFAFVLLTDPSGSSLFGKGCPTRNTTFGESTEARLSRFQAIINKKILRAWLEHRWL
jgi:hypothetical protein